MADLLGEEFRFGSYLEVAITGSTVLNETDARRAKYIVVTGTLTANATVTMPRYQGGEWIVRNATTGGFAVTFKGATGTGVQLTNSVPAYIADNGVNYDAAGSGTGAGSLAYATTTSSFVMPAPGSSVAVNVDSTALGALQQVLFIESAGYFRVAAKGSSTQYTLVNLGLTSNAAQGSTIATAKLVTAGGEPGALGSSAVVKGTLNRNLNGAGFTADGTYQIVTGWDGSNAAASGVTVSSPAGTLTVPSTGAYRIACHGIAEPVSGAELLSQILARVTRNGVAIPGFACGSIDSAGYRSAVLNWNDDVDLAAGDVIRLEVSGTKAVAQSGAAIKVAACVFSLEKVENSGATGQSAYTTTSAGFTMPAVSSTVTVSVASSTWMSIGQMLYVQDAGYMRVSAVPTTTSVTLTNVGTTGNAAATTAIVTARTVSAAGEAGALTGTAGGVLSGTYPNPAFVQSVNNRPLIDGFVPSNNRKAVTALATIANTETRIVGDTIAANSLRVGDQLVFEVMGVENNTTAASTSTFRVRIGGTTLTGAIVASNAYTMGTTARTNIPFSTYAVVTILSIGATGTALGQVMTAVDSNGVAPLVGSGGGLTAAVTIDTTISNEVELTVISGAASTTWGIHSGFLEHRRLA